MRLSSILLGVLSLLVLAPSAVHAQGAKIVFSAPEEERIQPRRLANGLDVVVIEKHNAPLVTIEIAVRAGAFIEDKSTNGLSHLYEHMFFKGNKRIPTQEAYMKRISELGIAFNGTTSNERVNYFITLPSRSFADGAQFMSDALLTPLFNQEELEKERLVVTGEYDRKEASPEHWLNLAMEKAAYGDDYLRKNAIGVRETILSATREIMQKFKDTYYIPNNAILMIVGDVNPTEAHSLAERYFGPAVWKAGEDPFFANPRPPIQRIEKSQAVLVGRERAVQTLAVRWNGPDTDRDPHGTIVADVLHTMLAQPRGRFQRAFKDGKLATLASLGYFTQRDSGELHFRAQITADARNVRDTLLSEIAAMTESGYFQDDDLGLAKQTMRTNRAFEKESGAGLSHAITFSWASASLDYYSTYLDEVEKVTCEDLRHFVQNYLVGKPWIVGVLMDPPALESSGLTSEKLLETPPAAAGAAAADVKAFSLSNGIRAIVRHDAGTPIGALVVFSEGGSSQLTKTTQGLDRLAIATALEGSKDVPRERFKKEIAAVGGRLGMDFSFDESHVAVAAPNAGFPVAADLLVSCLRSPELADDALSEKRAEILKGLEGERASPDAMLRKIANQVTFAGHPYENRPEGTEETVKSFDAAACQAAVARMMAPSRLVVVLVSGMGEEEARSFLEERFSWAKAPETADPARVQIPRIHPTTKLVSDKRAIPTTYIRGTFALPSPQDDGYLVSRVLMNILRERLWDAIRTKNALSYAPGAGGTSFRSNFGIVSASTVKPQRTIEVMLAELKRLREELVPETDLRAVLVKDFTSRAARGESAMGQALALGQAEVVNGSWRRYYDEPQDLARITSEQVRDTARKYLVDLHWAVVGPETVDEKVLDDAPAK